MNRADLLRTRQACTHCGRDPVDVDPAGLIAVHRRADWQHSPQAKDEYCLRAGYQPGTACTHNYVNHHCVWQAANE